MYQGVSSSVVVSSAVVSSGVVSSTEVSSVGEVCVPSSLSSSMSGAVKSSVGCSYAGVASSVSSGTPSLRRKSSLVM